MLGGARIRARDAPGTGGGAGATKCCCQGQAKEGDVCEDQGDEAGEGGCGSGCRCAGGITLRPSWQNILESTNDQLDAATKRTMAENEQMTTELQYQSKETEKLLAKNAKLTAENAGLRREQEVRACAGGPCAAVATVADPFT